MKAVEFFNKNKDKFHDFFGLSLNKYLVSELLVIDVGSFDIIKFDSGISRSFPILAQFV